MSPSVDFRDYLQTDEEALGGKFLTIKCNFIALEILESDMFYIILSVKKKDLDIAPFGKKVRSLMAGWSLIYATLESILSCS